MAHRPNSKTSVLSVKVTDEQRRLIEKCAQQCKVPTSVLVRSVIIQFATRRSESDSRGNEFTRIRKPDGVTI